MCKSQTVRSIDKIVASMSIIMHCFVGSIGEKNGYYKALNRYLSEIRFCAKGNMS